MTSVVFNPQMFKLRFNALFDVPDDLLQEYFDEATLYIANDDTSIIKDAGQRKVLLNLLVAHLAVLNHGENGQPASGMVGRITSASEGSISASAEYTSNSELAAWFNQTRYGAELWALLARYRTFRYVPAVRQARRFRGGWQ